LDDSETYFTPYEGKDINIDNVINFLNEHYNHSTPIQILYSKEYLNWFFSKSGILGVIKNKKQWLALVCLGGFTLRYNKIQGDILCGGLVCVHREHTFKGLAQRVVKEVFHYAKSKYNTPILGAGAGGFKKNRMFKNFGMFSATELKPPKNKRFSSNNLHLCDDSDFIKKFETEYGFVYYYPQEVIYEGVKEKWLVIPSYFTCGCWKTLIYDCFKVLRNDFSRVLVFQNSERKPEDLTEIGFKNISTYNLYVDSPINLPEYFLYYNLFLY